MTDHAQDEKAVFLAALERPSREARDAFLAEACAGDPERLERLRVLLRTHEESLGPLDSPPHDGDPTAFQPVAEKPGDTIGPYKLLQQIGEGGMGVVYMAEQTEPIERRVALKIIKPGMDTRQVIARFEAERQALAMMDHPNIAKVLDAGVTQTGRPYFVMELVKGKPITEYCDEHHLTPTERLALFVPVCQAVQHAHQKGIIHRDIKPSNVLVADYDDQPVPKVIDFGVAKAIDHRLTERTMFTEFGQVLGTFEYMSPEQAKLNQWDVDTRTDVYSLGVLLYELLSGEVPFDRQRLRSAAIDELLRIIREEDPPRPSTRLSTSESLPTIATNRKTEPKKLGTLIHGELDWIVMRALEKDRTRRYDTASKFAEDVKHYLAGEAVEACPPSAAYRFRKFVKRNRAAVAAGSLVAAALLLAVVGTTTGMIWALREREEADRQRARAMQREEEAIDAIRRFGDSVANNPELKNRPELAPLRKKLLQEPLEYFKSIGEQLRHDADTRPESLARLAQASFDLASLNFEIGRRQDALSAHEESLRIREQLARDHPRSTGYQRDLAASHTNIGIVLRSIGRLEEALAAYQQAVTTAEGLVHGDPAVTEYQEILASAQHNLAILHMKNGQPVDALKSFQQAMVIRERLAPDVTKQQGSLAASLNCIGVLHYKTGQFDEALASYHRALDIGKRLVLDNPEITSYRRQLAGSHNNIGNVHSKMGRLEEALAAYQQSLEIRERLAREHPTVIAHQRDLASSHANMGRLLEKIGTRQQALGAYDKALVIRELLADEHRTVTAYREELADLLNNIALLRCEEGEKERAVAQHRQALALRERLAEDNPNVPDCQDDLARSHYNIAATLMEMKLPEKALAQCQLALAIRSRLVQDNPKEITYLRNLARDHYLMGQLLSLASQQEEALAAYQQVKSIRERLVQEYPGVPDYQRDLAACCYARAELFNDLGQLEKATASYQRALALYERLVREQSTVATDQESLETVLSDLAKLDIASQRFAEACNQLNRVIKYQERALAIDPNHLGNRQRLARSYLLAVTAAEEAGDEKLAARAHQSLSELSNSADKPFDGSIASDDVASNDETSSGRRKELSSPTDEEQPAPPHKVLEKD